MATTNPPSQRYAVEVERTADGARAETRMRDFTLTTGARRGDPTVGPNAVETLLAALGTCRGPLGTPLSDGAGHGAPR